MASVSIIENVQSSRSVKTVLFYAMESQGHMNASAGLGSIFRRNGHRCVFATSMLTHGRFASLGFEEYQFAIGGDCGLEQREPEVVTERPDVNLVSSMAQLFPLPPIQNIPVIAKFMLTWFGIIRDSNAGLADAVARIRPDLIVVDCFVAPPAFVTSGIPWISLWSANPLFLHSMAPSLPMPFSGLPAADLDSAEAKEYNLAFCKSFENFGPQVKEFYKAHNIALGEDDANPLSLFVASPFLTVYQFPKEMDYVDIHPLSSLFVRFDHLIAGDVLSAVSFEIPVSLQTKPGKLVLFSMGSFGGADTAMMTRLLGILKDSPHRFIVSKGPMGDTFELPGDNMWGENFLPQLSVYPVIDLVITHGGNNTLCECFYFGKKMVCLPLFGDQPDNAQRLEEKGMGKRLSPYHATKEEVLAAIEDVLRDEEMQKRVDAVSARLRSQNTNLEAIQRAEALMESKISGVSQ